MGLASIFYAARVGEKKKAERRMTTDSLDAIIKEAEQFSLSSEDPVDFYTRPDPSSISELDTKLSKLPANDFGNAMRILQRGGTDLLWIDESGWLGWSGKHWSLPDGGSLAVKKAHGMVKEMRGEVLALLSAGGFPNESDKDFEKRVNRFNAFRVKSGDIQRVKGALDSASPYLKRQVHEMDADPMLFNVQNGTICLKSPPQEEDFDIVQIRDHSREDCMTKLADVEFNRSAECPHFMSFLADILPDENVRDFLQVWLGYSISGLICEQFVVMFHGGGSNGKSTFLDLLNGILGDYAMTLPFASLLKDDKKRGAEATPDLARLPGARFVTAAEPETGSQFSESALKQLTGGEKITARHLNKGFFEFHPKFKLILSFNNKPQIRGQDDGIWRRVLLVPFEQKFVTEDKLSEFPNAKIKDPQLPARLKEEASGILNWLLDGWRIYSEKGLVIPEVVRVATAEYRQESNPVGEFISSWTIRKTGGRVLASKLYAAYSVFCKEAGFSIWKQKTFGDRLTEQGIKRDKIGGYYHYLDLELTSEADAATNGGGPIDNRQADY